ncbi:hypothetical protein V8E53_014120 [Lactarius tabidus]
MVLWRKLRARLHCHFDVAFFLPLLVQPVGADQGGMSKFLFNVSNASLFRAMDSCRPVLPSSPTTYSTHLVALHRGTLDSSRVGRAGARGAKRNRADIPHPATLARRDLTRNEVLTHAVASLVQKLELENSPPPDPSAMTPTLATPLPFPTDSAAQSRFTLQPPIDLARETTAVSEDITGLRVEEQLLSQIQHEQDAQPRSPMPPRATFRHIKQGGTV